MTDPATTPEKIPDVAEIVGFLRRFAELMSNGYNAAYLHRAAGLLETLTARVVAASDEDELARYKYETLGKHAETLEAECEALKQDIEGQLEITSTILTERDALGVTLTANGKELSELRDALNREREERAAKVISHEEALGGFRASFDQEREALQASRQAGAEERDELRRTLRRERDEGAAKLAAGEDDLAKLRVTFDVERMDLQARLKARDDELAALRVVSRREHDALREKVAALEAKRAELRTAFDRISDLRNQAVEPQGAEAGITPMPGVLDMAHRFTPKQDDRQSATEENSAIVPKATLRQARAQFEYLAREFVPLGDIASQVMCELGAYTVDLALVGGKAADEHPAGVMAESILAGADR